MSIDERLAGATLPPDRVGQYAIKATRNPSVVMMTLCVIWIIVLIGELGFALVSDVNNYDSEIEYATKFTGLKILTNCLLGIGSVVLFLGSSFIFAMRNYQLAKITTIIGMIPFVTPGIVIGIPIAIWAYAVLQKREVMDSFHNID